MKLLFSWKSVTSFRVMYHGLDVKRHEVDKIIYHPKSRSNFLSFIILSRNKPLKSGTVKTFRKRDPMAGITASMILQSSRLKPLLESVILTFFRIPRKFLWNLGSPKVQVGQIGTKDEFEQYVKKHKAECYGNPRFSKILNIFIFILILALGMGIMGGQKKNDKLQKQRVWWTGMACSRKGKGNLYGKFQVFIKIFSQKMLSIQVY